MTSAHPHTHEHTHRQAGADTLLLDIGGDIGALTIMTDADREELEVEISPAGADPTMRTHNVVRARRVGARTVYAAVFPSVAAGEYTVWHDDSSPAGTVVVRGGAVSDYQL